ncbi:MAG: hypothetical protein AABX35_01890 [Nanoarchaeota archaeon]
MKKEILSLPVVWSNIFFIFPLAVAFILKIYLYIPLLLCVIFFSIRYHFTKQKRFYLPDHIFALILIASNFYLYFSGGFNDIYATLIPFFILITLSFHYYRKKVMYQGLHALWHLFSALLTVLCLLTYVY